MNNSTSSKKNRFAKLFFIVSGIASTVWFLIRVIPKPQRAAYPCMRAAAPVASAFVLYLLGIATTVFSLKRVKQNIRSNQLIYALGFLVLALFASLIVIPVNPSRAISAEPDAGLEPANSPMGTAVGIYPGRVVWVYDPDATNENCTNGYGDGYFMDKNTDQSAVDFMLKNAVMSITGEDNVSDSWDAIFKFHNQQRGKGNVGYQSGEVILIKINATSTWGSNINSDFTRVDNDNYAISETSPHVVTSVLDHLVNVVGVPQNKIYVGDPLKHIYQDNYEKWADEFPDVHYLDNNSDYDGREPVQYSSIAIIDYSDRGEVLRTGDWSDATVGDPIYTDHLYTIFEKMDYLINLPTMKGHERAGVTMFAKNHFGSHTRGDAKHLHGGIVNVGSSLRNNYSMYRVLVDIMGHELLGKKNLIYIMDALYTSEQEVTQPDKWQMSPWNNDWTSSIFISQDPVAIESVGFDFLYHEFDGSNGLEDYPHYGAVDDYLHQAADPANWPEGISYDPENDGTALTSMGVHEHWNNAIDREYTRNLGTGDGIELVSVDIASIPSVNTTGSQMNIKVFPNPCTDFARVSISNNELGEIQIELISMNGEIQLTKQYLKTAPSFETTVYFDGVASGIYMLKTTIGDKSSCVNLIID